MVAYYDTIAKQEQQSKQLPSHLHIEVYTYLNWLGELSGQIDSHSRLWRRILDQKIPPKGCYSSCGSRPFFPPTD